MDIYIYIISKPLYDESTRNADLKHALNTFTFFMQLSTLPSLVQCSLQRYFINESGFSETSFYSPNQHDLQIQFTCLMLCVQYVVLWCCISRRVQAIAFVRYSSSVMVYRGGSGARCSSVVRAFAHGAMGRRIDPP